ncbi:MAG: RNA ligase/cyclic nucleotide phosphodiesterase [candidate division WS6 bacterium 34_10]|uniref:RNA ligase/cyclic nucleotide phosphodiesterase n=1 Tax=candidate division WS6 bacterium 34_10 TaxID=1641389 RepID=A0A117LZV4_9BACT|nr:MAG: RNA ligase/cyclic nucleotide phosphodiesterase [candidate division WS6 bacterium 34_10]
MNHFLGYFIDDKSKEKIIKSKDDITDIFSDMGIQVRWIKPSDYHIKLQNLNDDVGPLKKLYISKKVDQIFDKPITVSLGNIKLGSNRSMRSLLYMEIEQGGDTLRDLKYKMANTLKIKDNGYFQPHVAIGRINKDLSNQEISNIVKDMRNVLDSKGTKAIQFDINQIDLVRVKDSNYEILKNFKASS